MHWSAKPSLHRCYFERIHLSINKKLAIIEQCVGVVSSSARNRISTWTCEFMDKTPQIAEEQLVMTIDKAQETKLQRYKS